MLRLIPKILALLILISCGNPEDMNLKKYRKVSMKMGYSDASSRSSSRDNENLLSGIGTEVIYLVPDSMTFNVKDGYQNLVAFEDRALTDIETNRVILNLPLDTPLKIYAYRFEDTYSLADIDSIERTPLSFGLSGSFIITSSTSSITVSLSITPNGEPGIQIGEPNISINNLGGSGTFTIKLNTHPKHQVTIPISVDNPSIATISPDSLSFTPPNWSDTKTVTIVGKTNVDYSDNTSLGVSIGPSSSEDSDYSQITETFTLTSKSFPITPVNLTASTGDGFVSLDWDQVSNATGYNVYYDEMSGVTDNDSVITGITDDNYTLSNLQNNTTYYFRVASVNSNGISALSSEVSATPSSNNSSSDFSCSDNASTCISWSDNFTQGNGATTSQITRYNDFWNNISVSDNWTSISIGTPDNLTTCDNASEIISMYKDNGPNSTNIQCNGNYWYVGTCGSGPGISVTPTTSHSCSCKTNNVWTVRPNIGSTNSNWGGVGKECNAPSQTLTVILGSKWQLIAKQVGNDNDIPLFDNNTKTTFLQNDNDSDSSTFMSIGKLNANEYITNGSYKFKLVWGGLEVDSSGINKEVEWTQTSWLDNSTISGFSELGTSGFVTGDNSTGFSGLGKSDNPNCVIDGNADSNENNHWWNCVGATGMYNEAIPGPLVKKASSME